MTSWSLFHSRTLVAEFHRTAAADCSMVFASTSASPARLRQSSTLSGWKLGAQSTSVSDGTSCHSKLIPRRLKSPNSCRHRAPAGSWCRRKSFRDEHDDNPDRAPQSHLCPCGERGHAGRCLPRRSPRRRPTSAPATGARSPPFARAAVRRTPHRRPPPRRWRAPWRHCRR